MLANVDVRSRPDVQFEENTDTPNGDVALLPYWLRCGIDPARKRDSNAALLAELESWMSPRFGDGDLNGLGEGVGRDVLAINEGNPVIPLPAAPPGENRDGTVPARARLACGRLSGVGRCVKSGKPSVGDSGIFSRRGVEFPLVGGPGPHTLAGTPS
jgi:hypothetical protein